MRLYNFLPSFFLQVMLYIAMVPRGYNYLTPIGPILDLFLLCCFSFIFCFFIYSRRINFLDVLVGIVISAIILSVRLVSFDPPEYVEILFAIIFYFVIKNNMTKKVSEDRYFIGLALAIPITVLCFFLKKNVFISSDYFNFYNFLFVLSYGISFVLTLTFVTTTTRAIRNLGNKNREAV